MPDTPFNFQYQLHQKVRHVDAPGDTFTVCRRWLDADLPEGANRFYMLEADRPLLGYNSVGPVAEAELSATKD